MAHTYHVSKLKAGLSYSSKTLSQKNKSWVCNSVTKHLLSKCKALSLIPNIAN
jgi:hypothetical protein